MPLRTVVLACALLVAAATSSGAAFQRGSVYLEVEGTYFGQKSGDLWEYEPSWNLPYTISAGGCLLINKCVAFGGKGFLMPATNLVVFHDGHTVAWSDGAVRSAWDPEEVFQNIFSDEAELGEIAPMRSGNLLVAERSNNRAHGAKLIEFNRQGRVAEYAFPELAIAPDRVLGATHIELLADQCTLLYTTGNDYFDPAPVRRMNICTGKGESDFASLVAGTYAGSIRQLPAGDVLVANGQGIQRFTPDGRLVQAYPIPGVTHIALSDDATWFYAAGVENAKEVFVRIDLHTGLSESIGIGNPGMGTAFVPSAVSNLVTVGEWRVSAPPPPPRARAVRRGR